MASPPEQLKRILLVDDHAAVSKRIGELLASVVPQAEMVAASSGEQGLALVAESTFDLVLLDLRLPGCGGIDVLKELRATNPGLPVIIISSLPESPYATLARRAGARGFVTKSALVQELGQAVRTVLGDSALA
jgi:two-component system invasion response regulator UvrY